MSEQVDKVSVSGGYVYGSDREKRARAERLTRREHRRVIPCPQPGCVYVGTPGALVAHQEHWHG